MKKQINHKFKIHRKRAHNHSKNKAKKQKTTDDYQLMTPNGHKLNWTTTQ